jgi:uncharacterized RDD family membrane protein YckC
MKRPKKLYQHQVCSKCVSGFANRRQFAFVLDMVLLYAIEFFAAFVVVMLASDELGQTPVAADRAITFSFLGLFLLKDGFSGFSPGKWLMGVQAVKRETGQPVGFRESAARNLPLLLPFVPLIVAVQLMKGYRLGDGWSKAKVIWCRYADHPIFTGKPLDPADPFGPRHVDLPPVEDTTNPYHPPRA